jgi:hypothetical protein
MLESSIVVLYRKRKKTEKKENRELDRPTIVGAITVQ